MVHLFVRNFGLNQNVKPSIRTCFPAKEHVEALFFDPIHGSGGTAEADIRNLMLTTRTRTSAKVNPHLILVVRTKLLQLPHHSNHSVLGFTDGQITELDPCAGYAALTKITRLDNQTRSNQIFLECFDVLFGNIDDDKVLLVRSTHSHFALLPILF